jgi:hypothetical protein
VQGNACSGKFELLLTEQTMTAPSISIQAWGHTSGHSSSSSEVLIGELQLITIADITTALSARHAVLYRIAALHSCSITSHNSSSHDCMTAQYSPAAGTVALRVQLLEPTSDTDAWTQLSSPVAHTSSELAETGTTAVRICCLDATNLPLVLEQSVIQDDPAATAAATSITTVVKSNSTGSASSGSIHVGAVRCRMFLNNRHIGDSPLPLLQPSQQQLHTDNSVEARQLSLSCPVWHADGSGCDLALQQQQTAAVGSDANSCVTLHLKQHGIISNSSSSSSSSSSSVSDQLCVELYQRTAAGTDLWIAGATLSTSHILSRSAAASCSTGMRQDVLLATALQHTARCMAPSIGLYIQSAAACSTSSIQTEAVAHKEGTVPRRWLRVRLRGHTEADVTADSTVQCCVLVNRRLFGSCAIVHGGSAQQRWHGKFDVLLPATTSFSNPEIRVAVVGANGFLGYATVEYDTTVHIDKASGVFSDAAATAQQLQAVGVADAVLARLACRTQVTTHFCEHDVLSSLALITLSSAELTYAHRQLATSLGNTSSCSQSSQRDLVHEVHAVRLTTCMLSSLLFA